MSEDDERARERAVILQRRAKLVAYAVAAGVATAACSGKTTCLTPILKGDGGTGGTPVTSGGRGFCLTAPGGNWAMGGIVSAGSGGLGQICLQPPLGGSTTVPVAGTTSGGETSEGGAAGEGGATGEAGAAGKAGAPGEGGVGGIPKVCLVPPA